MIYPDISLQQLNVKEKQKSIDIAQVRKAIEFSEKHIKIGKQGNHVVIFWGYTGTGKSTSIIILNGQQVWAYNNRSFAVLTNNLNEDVKKQIKKQHDQGKIVIYSQQNIQSGTIYPSCLPMNTLSSQQTVMLWDTPGFGDTRSATQILINTYFIYRLFNLQQQIKMVFTINYNDLDVSKKGGEFKKIVSTLSAALKNFSDYEQSMALLITKANNLVTKQIIQELLKENAKIKYQGETLYVRKFYNLVSANRIPILFIKRPQITAYHTKQNAKDTTNDYAQFVSDFYKTITAQLVPAKVPKLVAPGMEPDDIKKCFELGKQRKQNILNMTRFMLNDLKNYIQKILTQINFKNDLEYNKIQIEKVNNLIKFINKFIQIGKSIKTNKQEYQNNFSQISQLFKSNSFQIQQESGLSKPTQSINNQFIILDFLECINIPSNNQIQYDAVFKQFYQIIGTQILPIQQTFDLNLQQVQIKFQLYLSTNIEQQIQKWKYQNVYKMWRQNIKTMPSLYLKLGKFNKQMKLQNYFKQLKRLQLLAGMDCSDDLYHVQQTYDYVLRLQTKLINSPPAFIINKVTKKMNDKISQLKYQLSIDAWQQSSINNINYNQIIQQGSDLFQKLVNKNEQLANQKTNCQNKIHILNQRIKKLQQQNSNKQAKNAVLQVEKNNYKQRKQFLQKQLNKLNSEEGSCCALM